MRVYTGRLWDRRAEDPSLMLCCIAQVAGEALVSEDRAAKMAGIVYHLPVLPTHPAHANHNDKNRWIFSAAVGSNLG